MDDSHDSTSQAAKTISEVAPGAVESQQSAAAAQNGTTKHHLEDTDEPGAKRVKTEAENRLQAEPTEIKPNGGHEANVKDEAKGNGDGNAPVSEANAEDGEKKVLPKGTAPVKQE